MQHFMLSVLPLFAPLCFSVCTISASGRITTVTDNCLSLSFAIFENLSPAGSGDVDGGAINLSNGSTSVSINDTLFHNCTAPTGSGGCCSLGCSLIVFHRCCVVSCYAYHNGNFICFVGLSSDGLFEQLTLVGCAPAGRGSEVTHSGGYYISTGITNTFQCHNFTKCFVFESGVAFYADELDSTFVSSFVTIAGCGGGWDLICSACEDPPTLEFSNIVNNSAYYGILCFFDGIALKNCTFMNNDVTDELLFVAAVTTTMIRFSVVNCQFSDVLPSAAYCDFSGNNFVTANPSTHYIEYLNTQLCVAQPMMAPTPSAHRTGSVTAAQRSELVPSPMFSDSFDLGLSGEPDRFGMSPELLSCSASSSFYRSSRMVSAAGVASKLSEWSRRGESDVVRLDPSSLFSASSSFCPSLGLVATGHLPVRVVRRIAEAGGRF
jgi:hypothetical protein